MEKKGFFFFHEKFGSQLWNSQRECLITKVHSAKTKALPTLHQTAKRKGLTHKVNLDKTLSLSHS